MTPWLTVEPTAGASSIEAQVVSPSCAIHAECQEGRSQREVPLQRRTQFSQPFFVCVMHWSEGSKYRNTAKQIKKKISGDDLNLRLDFIDKTDWSYFEGGLLAGRYFARRDQTGQARCQIFKIDATEPVPPDWCWSRENNVDRSHVHDVGYQYRLSCGSKDAQFLQQRPLAASWSWQPNQSTKQDS